MRVQKSLAALVAAVGILPLFTGCDLSADFWDERTFKVDVPADQPKSEEGTEQTVDLSQHKEISDKLNELKDLDIAEIWVEIPTVDDATNKTTKASGTLKMKGPNEGDQWIEVGKYTDLEIKAGAKIEIVPDAAMVAKVKDWALHGSHKFFVTYSAEMDQLPAKFETKTRIHIVATAGL